MERGQWPLALGLALVLLLAGCVSGTGGDQSQSPTPSPTEELSPQTTHEPSPTPSTTPGSLSAACPNSVAFYGLDSPGETAWAPDRIAIGYTVPANASVFFVAFEEGTVVGTTHVTTVNFDHGLTADGDGIPLEKRFTGSKMIHVGAYADTNANGKFDFGNDMPCKSDGQPVEAGPRRINFSSFADTTDSPSPSATPAPEEVIEYDALPPEAQQEFRTALEQNGLKECEIALLDVDQPLIKYQSDYYTYAVQSGSGDDSTEECGTDFLNVEKVEKGL